MIAEFIKVEKKFLVGRSDLKFDNDHILKITKEGKSALMVTGKKGYGFAVGFKDNKLFKPFMVKLSKIEYYIKNSFKLFVVYDVNIKTNVVKLGYKDFIQSNDFNSCMGDLYLHEGGCSLILAAATALEPSIGIAAAL